MDYFCFIFLCLFFQLFTQIDQVPKFKIRRYMCYCIRDPETQIVLPITNSKFERRRKIQKTDDYLFLWHLTPKNCNLLLWWSSTFQHKKMKNCNYSFQGLLICAEPQKQDFWKWFWSWATQDALGNKKCLKTEK